MQITNKNLSNFRKIENCLSNCVEKKMLKQKNFSVANSSLSIKKQWKHSLFFSLQYLERHSVGEGHCYTLTEYELKPLCQCNWLKNPHLSVLLLSIYRYHFNLMWVEITLSAQSIEKSTTPVKHKNLAAVDFCTHHKKIDKILRRLGARRSPLFRRSPFITFYEKSAAS